MPVMVMIVGWIVVVALIVSASVLSWVVVGVVIGVVTRLVISASDVLPACRVVICIMAGWIIVSAAKRVTCG